MVRNVREIEEVMSSASFSQTEGEKSSVFFRRSLFVVKDVKRGDPVTGNNVRSIRPGNGMSPIYYYSVTDGTYCFNADYEEGTPLHKDMIQ
jgi:sialic acid synthase SpsE